MKRREFIRFIKIILYKTIPNFIFISKKSIDKIKETGYNIDVGAETLNLFPLQNKL